MSAPAAYRFAGFQLIPGERQLFDDGAAVPLGPRAFDVLVVLVERAGRLVDKAELLDLVWPNLIVEENNLQGQVSALRKILGADAIATVRGQGYRFVLDVTCELAALASAVIAPRHNLPQQVTSFIGRDREATDIKELFEKTRLLTLVGFGGIGKTRLSIRVAADLKDRYPDGVWLVELAPLTDARLVPQEVASVLGVRGQAGRPVLEGLLQHVKDQQLLLIIDSCEHLVHACAGLAKALLQSGANLKILATSRERLHIAGEKIYLVPPLGMPELNHPISLDALPEYEAVGLFIERAVASQPAFKLTRQNAGAVIDITRRVDGIPLAIELAAARMRALSVETIAERLEDRLKLLTNGDRTAEPRQHTLRALIDWSYYTLTERERMLFRRLAVFAGGWTLEAAEVVAASSDVERTDVLDVLTELVEKSLVVVQAEGNRYRFLDTVREYAQERLNESGEEDTRVRHLAFYSAFAEAAAPELLGSKSAEWVARLDVERENLLVAHAWCARAEGGAQIGLRLVCALRDFWPYLGLFELGYRVTVEATRRANAQDPTGDRARALSAAAYFANLIGNYAEAEAHLEESVSIFRKLGDEERITHALFSLGLVSSSQGKLADARRHFEEALRLARQVQKYREHVLAGLAALSCHEGDLNAAEPLFEEALTGFRASGARVSSALTLMGLAMVSIGRKVGDRACTTLLEALAIIEETGSRVAGLDFLGISAGLGAHFGDWERAAQLWGAADAQSEQLGRRPDPFDQAFLSPLIARARKALSKGAFAEAEAAGRALSYEAAMAETRAWLEESRRHGNHPSIKLTPNFMRTN
jgi:non-specific serine/threonine protein kinase